jgi:actin-related protein
MDRKPPSSVRHGLSSNRNLSSPHTPQRTTSSSFSSPSTSFRQEEDAVIIELGSRYLRAGFEGEHAPQCCLTFGPSDSRRAGDYRDYLPEYAEKPKTWRTGEDWGWDYELWRMDLRDVDLGLVEDKLDRAVRQAYTKYLLTDPGSQRLILVLPSVVPHQLLETVLAALFSRFRYHGIMLLQQPTMCVVAAGLRSGLVVDIGWAETIVTAVCEYRECHYNRSIRAMKLLTQEMGKLLSRLCETAAEGDENRTEREDTIQSNITLDHCEEVIARVGWCRQRPSNQLPPTEQLNHLSISENPATEIEQNHQGLLGTVSIPMSSIPSSRFVDIPVQKLADPAERAFFAAESENQSPDDHEYPLHELVYWALLALPPDMRGICMSRIIITGGGSKIPGLKKRLLDEVSALLEKYGWDSRRGRMVDLQRDRLKEMSLIRQTAQTTLNGHPNANEVSSEHAKDEIGEKLLRTQAKDPPPVHGVLRLVESLGAWSGASLIASLRVKGIVEIDRDRFLQHGLTGASRDVEVSVLPQRLSFGPGVQKSGDRRSWTLGAWA